MNIIISTESVFCSCAVYSYQKIESLCS